MAATRDEEAPESCGDFKDRANEIHRAARDRHGLIRRDRADFNEDVDQQAAIAIVMARARKVLGCSLKVPLGATAVAVMALFAPSANDRFTMDIQQHGGVVAWKNQLSVTIRAAFRGELADLLVAGLDEVIEEALKRFGQGAFTRFVYTTTTASMVTTAIKIATYLYKHYNGHPNAKLPTPGELFRDLLTNAACSALATMMSPGLYLTLGVVGGCFAYYLIHHFVRDDTKVIKSSWSDVWQGLLCTLGWRTLEVAPKGWNIPATLDIPEELCCGITKLLPVDPVTLHGFMYERVAIENWIAKKGTHPMKESLKHCFASPCFMEEICVSPEYRYLVQEYVQANGLTPVY